jgi:hypothetical protein
LAEAAIGHTENRDLAHRGVGGQLLLHFGRIDVRSTPDDQIAGPSTHVQDSRIVQDADITGSPPSCATGVRVHLTAGPNIARHVQRSSDTQLPWLTDRQHHPVGVDQAVVAARQWMPQRAGAHVRRVRGPCHRHAGRFALPVGDVEPDTKSLFDIGNQRGVDVRGAAEHRAHRFEVIGRHIGLIE